MRLALLARFDATALRLVAVLHVSSALGCVQPEFPDDFEEIAQTGLAADAAQPGLGLGVDAGLPPVFDSGAAPPTQEPGNVVPGGGVDAQVVVPGREAGTFVPPARPDASVASEAGAGREASVAPVVDAETPTGTLASCMISANTDASNTFLYRGKYGCAVWIGDASKKVVKAFFLATRIASRSGLSTYRTASTGVTVDIVAGATLGAAKQHQYTWDLKGPSGAPVAPGKYTLNVETHSSNGDVTLSVPFELGSQPVSAMGGPMGEIQAASIRCQ
jgi:hypothetical protein